MDWRKLKHYHLHQDPVLHVHATNLMDTKEYDRLYENQNNLHHQSWQEFDERYKIGFEFKEDFSQVDFQKEIMCLWFFKERSDNTRAYVEVDGKELAYQPNTFLITKSKNIKLIQKKRKYIRHPVVQIDMTNDRWQDLVSKLA